MLGLAWNLFQIMFVAVTPEDLVRESNRSSSPAGKTLLPTEMPEDKLNTLFAIRLQHPLLLVLQW